MNLIVCNESTHENTFNFLQKNLSALKSKYYYGNDLESTTSTTGAKPSSSGGGIRLMRRWDNAEFWGGSLATVGIYNKALDAGQVASLWNSTKSRFGL